MEGVNAAGKRVSLLCESSEDRQTADGPRRHAHHASAKAPQSKSQTQLPLHLHSARPSLPSLSETLNSPSHHLVRPGPRPIVAQSYSSRSSISTTSTSASSTLPYHSDSDSSQSRHSSIASPRFSPAVRAVPRLSRHDSSSSAQSISTPSPMTPVHPLFEPLDAQGKPAINLSLDPSTSTYSFASHPSAPPAGLIASTMSAAGVASNAPFYPSSAQGALPVSASQTNMFAGFPAQQLPPFDPSYAVPAQMQFQYPTNLIDPMPDAAALGSSSLGSPTSLATTANAAIPPVDSSAAPSNAPGSVTKGKKKYPCPHAAKFNCHDLFTTSGHAARHGKKHTGEKNIRCPTCDKAFTRKDNMKQHERTHKNSRNNDSVDHGKPNGVTNGHSRRTQSISSVAASTVTHQSSNSLDMELDSPVVDTFDSKRSSMQRPSLGRPGQYSGSNSTGSGDLKLDPVQRPELNRQFSGESQDGEGESPGLDALAMAATSELR